MIVRLPKGVFGILKLRGRFVEHKRMLSQALGVNTFTYVSDMIWLHFVVLLKFD